MKITCNIEREILLKPPSSHSTINPLCCDICWLIYTFIYSHSQLKIIFFVFQETETLRGCLRNLKINAEEFEIPNNRRRDRIVGVGQCFASVQPGSYFPGDAYAIYSKNLNFYTVIKI